MVAEVAALGGMILLTRLIPPAEVGAAAVAVTFLMLSVILAFEGFGSPLVQRKIVTEEHRRTAQTVSVGSRILLGALIVVVAETAGKSLFGDRSAHLLMLTAPVYVIAGFSYDGIVPALEDHNLILGQRPGAPGPHDVLGVTPTFRGAGADRRLRAGANVSGAALTRFRGTEGIEACSIRQSKTAARPIRR